MTDFHAQFPKSGIGKQHPYLIERLDPQHSILDYGCGKGGTVEWLRKAGYNVVGYEPYVAEYSNTETLNRKYDTIYTQDVLEHIEQDEIPWQLFSTIAQEQIHIIDLTPAKKRLPSGENAHITLLPPQVWLHLFDTYTQGTIADHRIDTQPDPNFGKRERLCLHIKHG